MGATAAKRKPATTKTPRKTPSKEAAVKASLAATKKAQAEKAEAQKVVLNTLKPLAKEINVRLEKADKLGQQSTDHRVAAAIDLAKAKEQCDTAGIQFKSWCEDNLKQSYETARKLAAAGATDNPAEAIAQMRQSNAAANRALRQRTKAEKVSRETKEQEPPQLIAGDLPPRKRVPAVVREIEKLGRHAEEAVQQAAESLGLQIVDPADELTNKPAAKVNTMGLADLKKTFVNWPAKVRMDFLKWAANECGVKLDLNTADVSVSE